MPFPYILDVEGNAVTVAGNAIPIPALNPVPVGGELIVVAQSYFNSSLAFAPTTPTDGPGNSYTLGGSASFGAVLGIAYWYAIAKAGATTITTHVTNAGTGSAVAWLVSNIRQNQPFNNDNSTLTISVSAPGPARSGAGGTVGVVLGSIQLAFMTPGGTETITDSWNDMAYGMTPAHLTQARQTNNTSSQALYSAFSMARGTTSQSAAWYFSGNDTRSALRGSFAPFPSVEWYVDSSGVWRMTV